jgi:SAM-dependent methyltransferase
MEAMDERDYHDAHYAGAASAIEAGALFQRVHERAVRQFLSRAAITSTHRVLSLGCGDASIEIRLARHVGELVGVDISSVAIENARARAAGIGNVSFVVSESGRPRIEELGAFDAVVAFAFLHHLSDPAVAETLSSARKALRRGGVFYSVDPSRRRFVRLFTWLVREAYDKYHSPDERELEPDVLVQLALEAGFSRPKVSYSDYFLGPLAWLAPRAPRPLAAALEVLDSSALRVPLVRRYASSFSLLAYAS